MNDLIPVEEQRDESDMIIRPGGERPFVIPWCASCKDTVETFTVDALQWFDRIGVQATCHGQTEGTYVTFEQLKARKFDGVPVVMFRRRAFNLVR